MSDVPEYIYEKNQSRKKGHGCLTLIVGVILVFLFLIIRYSCYSDPKGDALTVVEQEIGITGLHCTKAEIIDETSYQQYLVKLTCDVETGIKIDARNITGEVVFLVVLYSHRGGRSAWRPSTAVMVHRPGEISESDLIYIAKIANKWGEPEK